MGGIPATASGSHGSGLFHKEVVMSNHTVQLQGVIDKLFQDVPRIKVLEAGCGSMSYLQLKDKASIVGIDISMRQLQRNAILDEAVHGDIMTHVFPPDSFDAIVCIDVLEHLDHPELALANFRTAVAPGGVLVLKLPNVFSIKGLLTKLSPHWFHVWVYRTLYKRKDAGRGETAPFKTYLKFAVSPPRLRKWCQQNQILVHYENYYESGYQRELKQRVGLFNRVAPLLEGVVRTLSFGKLTFERTEYVLVARKGASSSLQGA